MTKTWITSDLHLFHNNIIRYCNRPFKCIGDMNDTLIANWNKRVKSNDYVIYLGDFIAKVDSTIIKDTINKLNGNITFLRGNHDSLLGTNIEYLVFTYGNKEIYCTHKPDNYSSSYSINLVGHIHTHWKVRSIYNTILVNCGVDVWNFSPITMIDIMKVIDEYYKSHK